MFPEERDFKIADGVDQVRQVVRAQVKYGVDVIKVNASGGVLSRGDAPGAPQYSLEELKVLVEEAHAAGRKVAAHAHGAMGIKNAVRAGVDSIEHGSLIDDEGITLMIEHGTWLVADIYNDDYLLGKAIEFKLPAEMIAKEKMVGQVQRENFARAVKAGVKDRLRDRRRGLPPRRQRPPVLLRGQVRPDPGPGDPLGHLRRRRAARDGPTRSAGSPRAPCRPDRGRGRPPARRHAAGNVGFVMKGGKVVKVALAPEAPASPK